MLTKSHRIGIVALASLGFVNGCTPVNSATQPITTPDKSTPAHLIEIEQQRLDIEKERLEIEREQLEELKKMHWQLERVIMELARWEDTSTNNFFAQMRTASTSLGR